MILLLKKTKLTISKSFFEMLKTLSENTNRFSFCKLSIRVEWRICSKKLGIGLNWFISNKRGRKKSRVSMTSGSAITYQLKIIKESPENWQTQSRQSKLKSKADDLVFIKIAMYNHPPPPTGKFQRNKIELYFQNKSC